MTLIFAVLLSPLAFAARSEPTLFHRQFDSVRARMAELRTSEESARRDRFRETMKRRLARKLFRSLSGKRIGVTEQNVVTPGHYDHFDVVVTQEPPTYWAGEVTSYVITYADRKILCRLVGKFATPDYRLWRVLSEVDLSHLGCVPAPAGE